MSASPRPFLSDSAASRLKTRARARGWRTRYLMSDPQYRVRLYRLDTATKRRVAVEDEPVEVIVTPASVQPDDVASGAGAGGEFDTGTLSRFGGWDVEKGDTFTLDGISAYVSDVPVRVNGETLAHYRIGISAGQGR